MAETKTTKKTNTKVKTTKKTDNKVNLTEMENALNKVDTTIETEDIKVEQPETSVLENVIEQINEVEKAQEELNTVLEKEPEKAQEIIEQQIEKAQEIKEEVKKIMKSVSQTTYTWNGMYSDY